MSFENASVRKILMVCLGNICRSPLAEGILQKKLLESKKNSMYSIIVDSAGTSDYHEGSSPDRRSIQIANMHGVNIEGQQSATFKVDFFNKYDLIYVMDKSNYSDLLVVASNSEDKNKVKLILNELTPCKDNDVPDPYYGGEKGFDKVFALLDKTCDKIVLKLEKRNNER